MQRDFLWLLLIKSCVYGILVSSNLRDGSIQLRTRLFLRIRVKITA